MGDQAAELRKMMDQRQSTSSVATLSDQGEAAGNYGLTPEVDSADSRDSSRGYRPAEVIAVTSGKGGVGKSNVSVNLGIALAAEGKDVAVVDMDLGLANVNVITDVTPPHNLLHVFEGKKEISDIIVQGPGDIQVIAGASGEEELANLSRHECNLFLEKLEQLDKLVDVVIVDTAAGISEVVMQFVCASDQNLLVTTPEPTAITDAYAVVKAALRRGYKPGFNLVVNRAHSIKEGREVGKKMKRVSGDFLNFPLDVLGYVLEDRAVASAVRSRAPFYLEYPESRAAGCINHLAGRLLGSAQKQKPRGVKGFFSRIFNFASNS